GAVGALGVAYDPGRWSAELSATYAYLYARDVASDDFYEGSLLAPGARLLGSVWVGGTASIWASASALAVPGGPAGWGTVGFRYSPPSRPGVD
ncbi:MAG: hypothetical protein FJ102_25365, partial [Deltaproteobacteria bacterium]|nr:hypothetical protein [Deltaproteobacteria bacterium]